MNDVRNRLKDSYLQGKVRYPRLHFASNCVNWPAAHVSELTRMVEGATEITAETLRKHVIPADYATVEFQLGYRQRALTLARDPHVRFYRGRVYGQTVYFFTWSAIEYVFADHTTCRRLGL